MKLFIIRRLLYRSVNFFYDSIYPRFWIVSLIKQCRSAFSMACSLGSVFCHTSVVNAGHLFIQCALLGLSPKLQIDDIKT